MKASKDLASALERLRKLASESGLDIGDELGSVEAKVKASSKTESTWRRVELARHPDRPYSLDYISRIFDDFTEFHGDRYHGDDQAIVGGIGFLAGRPVTIIANQKGRNLKENMRRNHGMASPEGYRKALRLAKQAEKFHRPIVTFVDTSGAYPGIEAEERGIGEAIARNLREFSQLKTPIICVIIGEGGSGGALGICVGDKIYMLENAVYSVISPEGWVWETDACSVTITKYAYSGRPCENEGLVHTNEDPTCDGYDVYRIIGHGVCNETAVQSNGEGAIDIGSFEFVTRLWWPR